MKLDCYAVLGLSPTAEDVVIRAAYLALMRNYHPDRNGSPEAAARARAITQAYKLIGDPVRRAEYDASRWDRQFEILGYDNDARPGLRRKAAGIRWPKLPAMRLPKIPAIQWPRASMIGGSAAWALAIVLAVTVLSVTRGGDADTGPARTTESPNKEEVTATASVTTKTRPASEPVEPIASPPQESSPQAAPAAQPLPEKAMAARPASAVAKAPEPVLAKVDAPPKPRRTETPSPPPSAARPAAPKAGAVDERARVATLESMSTSFYNQSVSHADDARRSQLQQARDLFVNARNACRSDSCVGDAHASYIRDISRIMKKPN